MNQQALEAGKQADELIKQLANPSEPEQPKQEEKPKQEKPKQTPTDDWEKRFKGYKASTDKTIHDLRQQLNSLQELKQANEEMKRQLESLKNVNIQPPEEVRELFSDEEINGLDKLVESKVGSLQSEVERLQNELQRVKETEQKNEEISVHQSIVRAVEAAVPNYKEIDYNPDFAEWMNDVDDFGNIRYEMMVRAKNSTPPDIARIVQFYVDFEREAMSSKEDPVANEQEVYSQQELLQSPKTIPTHATLNNQQTRIWDEATIQAFYRDKSLGKISPEKARELEAEMFRYLNGG